MKNLRAFTLIELSIVLVIIGLIAGGILVGKDLIEGAKIRSQINQIQEFKTALNVFKLKYNSLPGDVLSSRAATMGLFASSAGPTRAWGDGNGLVESGGAGCSSVGNTNCFYGEMLIFFRHLTESRLIDGAYSLSNITAQGKLSSTVSLAAGTINNHIPKAKIGRNSSLTINEYNEANYFTIGGFQTMTTGLDGHYSNPVALPTFLPTELFHIDDKIDDGKPNSGNVRAVDLNGNYTSSQQNWVNTSAVVDCVTAGTSYTLSNNSTPACSLSMRME